MADSKPGSGVLAPTAGVEGGKEGKSQQATDTMSNDPLTHAKELGKEAGEIAKEGVTMPTPGNIKEMVYGKRRPVPAMHRHAAALLYVLLALASAPHSLCCGVSGSQAEIDAMLKLANKHRALHGSRPVKWNATLAATAKLWSKQCTITHSKGRYLDGKYGENTFYRFGTLPNGLQDCTAAETYWYNEVRNYNWQKPPEVINPNLVMILHFTQVVWADTRSIGCGTTACKDGNTYTVCQYYPQGNFQWCNWDTGKCFSYQENVFRTACQNVTQNDGCSSCSSTGQCTACYPETRTYDPVKKTLR